MEEPLITIRDIEQISEMRDVEELQREVWASNDLDIVPLTMLAATREVGGILIGAFDGSALVGFAYGFVGYENGHPVHHSHMLGVNRSYRNFNLGYKLKLAQRERVLAQGIARMTWTFDPLQSLNAYFNFNKLGVVADQYKVNFYGETTSSFLHQIGTDRLWASWLLDSERVQKRLEIEKSKDTQFDVENIVSLVQVGASNEPRRNELAGIFDEERLVLEIPIDINALQNEDLDLAMKWREATRQAFTEAITAGYFVEEFYRSKRLDRPVGRYLLNAGLSSGKKV